MRDPLLLVYDSTPLNDDSSFSTQALQVCKVKNPQTKTIRGDLAFAGTLNTSRSKEDQKILMLSASSVDLEKQHTEKHMWYS